MWLKRKCFTDVPSLFFSNFSADDCFQAENINSQLRSQRRRSNPVCDQQQVIARKTSLAEKLLGKARNDESVVSQTIELRKRNITTSCQELGASPTMNNSNHDFSKPNNLPLDLWSTSSSSDENNSSTDVNSFKQIKDKPPLQKNFEVVKEKTYTDECNSKESRLSSKGYINNASNWKGISAKYSSSSKAEGFTPLKKFSNRNQSPLTDEENLIESSTDQSSKRSSRSSGDHPLPSTSANDEPTENHTFITSIKPPLPPERHDSLYLSASEERDLRQAPWFQAGIPREITLEILSQQPVGSFMVRESTSKPGCFALSLRVPREFHGNGIAHYLILRTYKGGFKIKGFTKEFNTLSALITHHSVMSELLPCPLSLSRRNPTFRKHERDDFVDINGNSECRIFSGFRKISTDVNARV